jgi:hypothetical protein
MEENMEYDWEKDVEYDLIEQKIDIWLPDDVVLVGLALANIESVEGCLIVNPHWVGSEISQMDILQDVYGDAERNYRACLDAFGKHYDKLQANKRKVLQ